MRVGIHERELVPDRIVDDALQDARCVLPLFLRHQVELHEEGAVLEVLVRAGDLLLDELGHAPGTQWSLSPHL